VVVFLECALSASGVRLGKAAPFQWVKGPPGDLAIF
jgi:hypothetical protein